MLKAFSYVFAFAILCVVGIFGWLSFADVPVEQHTIEQTIQPPSDLPPAALAPEIP